MIRRMIPEPLRRHLWKVAAVFAGFYFLAIGIAEWNIHRADELAATAPAHADHAHDDGATTTTNTRRMERAAVAYVFDYLPDTGRTVTGSEVASAGLGAGLVLVDTTTRPVLVTLVHEPPKWRPTQLVECVDTVDCS